MICPGCHEPMALHEPLADGNDDFRANVYTPCCGVRMKLSTGANAPASSDPSADLVERAGDAARRAAFNLVHSISNDDWKRIARAVLSVKETGR